jgi:hypothetical protein
LEGVVMLASTNREDVLDDALLRPGRFDRQIPISLPTLPERKAIFEVYLKEIAKVLETDKLSSYSSRLAALTPGQSGKDRAGIRTRGCGWGVARELLGTGGVRNTSRIPLQWNLRIKDTLHLYKSDARLHHMIDLVLNIETSSKCVRCLEVPLCKGRN